MRGNVVAVGLLLVLFGALLWYYPLQSGSVGPGHLSSGAKYPVELNAPLDLLGAKVPFTLTWNSSASVTIKVYDCGTDSSCALAGSGPPVATATGDSGTLSWSGHPGHYYAVIPSGSSTTLIVNYTEPLYGGLPGVALFVFGVVVVLVGVGLSRPPPPTLILPAHFRTTATTDQDGTLTEPAPKSP